MVDLKSLHYYKPFTATLAGFIVPLITGIISACSSGLIIYIVLRSQEKLSTTYHRIMAFMSFFDIVSSIFIALGTIMVPSDNIFKFAGPMLGNDTTCKIQGWFILFAFAGGTSLNVSLSWYFVCKFAFKMSLHHIAKYIEPIMYTYTVALVFFVPSLYLAMDLIHSNAYDCFCSFVPYPESCDEEQWYDWGKCTWEDGDVEKYFKYANVAYFVIVSHFVLIVFGMSIILWTLHKKKQEICDLMDAENETIEQVDRQADGENGRKMAMGNLHHSRVLIFQALMYIVAFFLTWILNFLSGELNIASMETDAINSVLFPLQGLWNLLIFLYDKSYLIRQESQDSLSFWQATKKIATSPAEVPVFSVTNIEEIVSKPSAQDDVIFDVYDEASNLRMGFSVVDSSVVDSSVLNLSRANLSP